VPEAILLDNDVVLKVCAYRCHEQLMATLTAEEQPPAMLRLGRYALRSRLSKPGRIADREGAASIFEGLVERFIQIDPSPTEIGLATELEERAVSMGLEFDTGESQLVAVLLLREAPLLVTGDKRAIAALSAMHLTGAERRISCLEQLFAMLLAKHPLEPLRRGVCAEREADKAITACFACSGETTAIDDVVAGLASYIRHLRSTTGDILVEDADLLPVVS
jgi:hypothetical protein